MRGIQNDVREHREICRKLHSRLSLVIASTEMKTGDDINSMKMLYSADDQKDICLK